MPKMTPAEAKPLFLGRREFAEALGISVVIVDRHIKKGTLKHVRPLGSSRVLIPATEIERLLREADQSVREDQGDAGDSKTSAA